MPRSRAARKRQARDIAIGIAALAVFITALGGGLWWFLNRTPGLDRDTLCPQGGPTAHIVLLVDKTDPLKFNQKEAFLRLLEELVDRRVKPGQLVSVFVLGADFRQGAKPLVEVCNPGTGEGKSELTENVAKLNAQYRERFRERLLKQAEALVSTKPADSSPIFEMVQLVSLNGFRKHLVAGPRRLILVSDLLHKTPEISMYQGVPDVETLASSDYGRRMRTELEGVEVEIHQILHYPRLQTHRLLAFWNAYFARTGARVVHTRALEG